MINYAEKQIHFTTPFLILRTDQELETSTTNLDIETEERNESKEKKEKIIATVFGYPLINS